MRSLDGRAVRALAIIGVSAIALVVASVTYLRPWQSHTAPSAAQSVLDMQVASSSQGWVVVGDGRSSAILGTSDGGRHWRRLLAVSGGRVIEWFRWFDARHGVVYLNGQTSGPALLTTADGGRHWAAVTPPVACPQLFFLDPLHGWCLSFQASGLSLIGDGGAVSLYRTEDGGASWQCVLMTSVLSRVSNGLGDDGIKTGIWFRDPHTGWVGQSTQSGHAIVYATTDGGDTWSRQELAPPDGGWDVPQAVLEFTPAELEDGTVVMRAAPIGVVGGLQAEMGEYVYTWDGAWSSPVRLPGAVVRPGVGAVGFAGARSWWAVDGTSVLRTVDAGVTWQAVAHVPRGWAFRDLAVADVSHAWAMVEREGCQGPALCPIALAGTSDSGRHWSLLSVA